MDAYRAPYREPGESRRPTLTWPREIPIDGEPADVTEIVTRNAEWMASSPVPKLFVNGDPGALLTGALREQCRRWPAQDEVTVPGLHFLPEDSASRSPTPWTRGWAVSADRAGRRRQARRSSAAETDPPAGLIDDSGT